MPKQRKNPKKKNSAKFGNCLKINRQTISLSPEKRKKKKNRELMAPLRMRSRETSLSPVPKAPMSHFRSKSSDSCSLILDIRRGSWTSSWYGRCGLRVGKFGTTWTTLCFRETISLNSVFFYEKFTKLHRLPPQSSFQHECCCFLNYSPAGSWVTDYRPSNAVTVSCSWDKLWADSDFFFSMWFLVFVSTW